jgi:hypothetical protein
MMPDEQKPPPVNAPRTEESGQRNTTIVMPEETRFRWAERIGVGPVMALVCLGMIFYSLINSVSMLQTLAGNTTTALTQVADAVRSMKETFDESKKEAAERQKLIEARQKETDAKFLSIQQAVIANQTIMKDDVELSKSILAEESKSHLERRGFWEPALKELGEHGKRLQSIEESGKEREKIQADILTEEKRRCEAEEKHAAEVREWKGKTPTPAPVPAKGG